MVNISDVVGSSVCAILDDAQKVYDIIALAISTGEHITVSFLDITVVTPTFLNVAIGQLYGVFSEELILELLDVTDMQRSSALTLKFVVDNAKEYFKEARDV